MLLLNWKLPVIESELRTLRDLKVMLPPPLSVCLPLIHVTLSKSWKSFWFVISGWLPFCPRFLMFWKIIWVMPDVGSLKLMPGRPTALAGFCR